MFLSSPPCLFAVANRDGVVCLDFCCCALAVESMIFFSHDITGVTQNQFYFAVFTSHYDLVLSIACHIHRVDLFIMLIYIFNIIS